MKDVIFLCISFPGRTLLTVGTVPGPTIAAMFTLDVLGELGKVAVCLTMEGPTMLDMTGYDMSVSGVVEHLHYSKWVIIVYLSVFMESLPLEKWRVVGWGTWEWINP